MTLSLKEYTTLLNNLENIQLTPETEKEYGIDNRELPVFAGDLSINIDVDKVHINAAKKRAPSIGGDKIKSITGIPNGANNAF